jgi:hypothetical protein
MKTNKFVLTAIGFLTGIVLGISAMGLFAFAKGPVSSGTGTGVTSITAAQANSYFKNYISGAQSYNQVIKGFMVDRNQLNAMNNLVTENSGLTGFRIYMGIDNNSRKIGIVVGIDSNGKDAVNNTIYNTDSPNNNPCPPLCDSNSPVILN